MYWANTPSVNFGEVLPLENAKIRHKKRRDGAKSLGKGSPRLLFRQKLTNFQNHLTGVVHSFYYYRSNLLYRGPSHLGRGHSTTDAVMMLWVLESYNLTVAVYWYLYIYLLITEHHNRNIEHHVQLFLLPTCFMCRQICVLHRKSLRLLHINHFFNMSNYMHIIAVQWKPLYTQIWWFLSFLIE